MLIGRSRVFLLVDLVLQLMYGLHRENRHLRSVVHIVAPLEQNDRSSTVSQCG